MSMYEITVDQDLCRKDGLCAMTCMRGIFQQEEKNTFPELVDKDECYNCGQSHRVTLPQKAVYVKWA